MNKILAIALAIILFFLLGSFAAPSYPELAAGITHPYAAGITQQSGFARRYLNEAQQQLYDNVKAAVYAYESEIPVLRAGYTNEDISAVIWSIKQDSPEIFWVNMALWEIIPDSNSGSFTIRPTYIFEGAELVESMRADLEAACDAVVAAAAEAGAVTEFDKVRFVHDYLIQTVTYNEDAPDEVHTAYGALINKQAVCDGYTHAAQLILDKMGIECFYVQGYPVGGTPEDDPHSWNIVRIDGTYYSMDITWDDVENIKSDNWSGTVHSYRYFLLSTEEMAKDHVDTSPFTLPECVGYGFLKVNGLAGDSFVSVRSALIRNSVDNIRGGVYSVEFQLEDPEAYRNFLANTDDVVSTLITDINAALGAGGSDARIATMETMRDKTADSGTIILLFIMK